MKHCIGLYLHGMVLLHIKRLVSGLHGDARS